MKTRIFLTLLFSFFMISENNLLAQNKTLSNNYGRTLNLGLGIGGYSGYYGYRAFITNFSHQL